MTTRISIKFTGFNDLKKSIEFVTQKEQEFKTRFKDTGDEVLSDVKTHIESNRKRNKRGKSKLVEAIDITHQEDSTSIAWGIGEIDKLDREVIGQDGNAYWRAVNFGSNHIVGKTVYSHFDSESNGRLIHNHSEKDPEKTKFITFKNPIPAMNYIETGFNSLKNKIGKLIRSLR